MHKAAYRSALQAVATQTNEIGSAGTEKSARNGMHAALKGSLIEQQITKWRGVGPDQAKTPRFDIVCDDHAIELKVARLPRLKAQSPLGCLYDLGQIANDYLKIESAKDLESGELAIVLHGPLVTDLGPVSIYREFHNRMYVDYTTSCQFGELHPDHLAQEEKEWKRLLRPMQHRVIKRMGFHKPCEEPRACTVIKHERLGLALISISVTKSSRKAR